MISAIGSINDVNESVVIFSAFVNSKEEWNLNVEMGRNMIDEIKIQFPVPMDKEQRISHEVNYIDNRIEGFKNDNELLL